MGQIIERESDWTEHLRRIVNDPWYFACTCIFTKDETDLANPIKRFPQDLEYLEAFFKLWQRERFIAVPKSRRMFMTWGCLVLHLWDAMWHKGRNVGFVSKKEDDADQMIKKVVFMLENIREEDLPKDLRPKWHYKFNNITFEGFDSQISGYPQGADQLRMFTFSRILADEMAFWDHAESMYSSAAPTLEGGGCMTAVSSAAPGFFKRLVFDEINETKVLVQPKKIQPMQGVRVWRNPNNKFVVFELHYLANERKRKPEYIEDIKIRMPHQKFLQEYEISWNTQEGKPVFPDFNRKVHGSDTEITPEFGLPLILGVDQGLKPACVVMQRQSDGLKGMRVYRAVNMGAEKFVEYVKQQLAKDFPEWPNWDRDYVVGMDPTAFSRRDVDERTYSSVWLSAGFRPKPGANLFEKRKSAIEDLLTKMYKGKPDFELDLKNCDAWAVALEGGYRYPEDAFEIEPNRIRPIKDEHADIMDAMQYGVTAFIGSSSKRHHNVPRPSYAWSGSSKGSVNGQIKREKERL